MGIIKNDKNGQIGLKWLLWLFLAIDVPYIRTKANIKNSNTFLFLNNTQPLCQFLWKMVVRVGSAHFGFWRGRERENFHLIEGEEKETWNFDPALPSWYTPSWYFLPTPWKLWLLIRVIFFLIRQHGSQFSGIMINLVFSSEFFGLTCDFFLELCFFLWRYFHSLNYDKLCQRRSTLAWF